MNKDKEMSNTLATCLLTQISRKSLINVDVAEVEAAVKRIKLLWKKLRSVRRMPSRPNSISSRHSKTALRTEKRIRRKNLWTRIQTDSGNFPIILIN